MCITCIERKNFPNLASSFPGARVMLSLVMDVRDICSLSLLVFFYLKVQVELGFQPDAHIGVSRV